MTTTVASVMDVLNDLNEESLALVLAFAKHVARPARAQTKRAIGLFLEDAADNLGGTLQLQAPSAADKATRVEGHYASRGFITSPYGLPNAR